LDLPRKTHLKSKGIIEVTGRRRMKLLDDIKEKRGYCKLKEEALHRTLWTLPLDEFVNLS